MARQSPQTSLFAGPIQNRPAEQFQAHDVVFLVDGEEVARGPLSDDDIDLLPLSPTVRVRLRLTGEHLDSQLTEGPLTYSECRTWEEPCNLHSCRYRLEDHVERRTRRVVETEDDYGNPLVPVECPVCDGGDSEARHHHAVEGPRMPNGAFYSSAIPTHPGDWCALRVAERGVTLSELAWMYGVSVAAAREIEAQVLKAAGVDPDLVLEDLYGDRGRAHQFAFAEDKAELTAREAANAVVPGEETCRCEVPCGEKGKVCATCGVRIKRGRTALTVGRRRSRKDRWGGVVRRVPDEFERSDGTVVRTVPVEFMNQSRVNDTIPSRCSDMGEMLKARAAQRAKREEEAA